MPALSSQTSISPELSRVDNDNSPPGLPLPCYRLLVYYFRSGWAFLIPYLTGYLLYAWLRWPINPAGGGEGLVKGMGESFGGSSSLLHPPCLLHVYWFLHGLHLLLGGLVLIFWWQEGKPELETEKLESSPNLSAFDRFWPLLPWLCLALILWIPGAYLEWPADPWEHYARITRWKATVIMQHGDVGSFYKPSFYFFAYSLLGHLPLNSQLKALDIYEATMALLVSWQFYRLARICGLTVRSSMLSTLFQVLLFGNDVFGFYRYYGLSSTAFSQLGALAAIRIGIAASLHRSFRVSTDGTGSFGSESVHLGALIFPLLLTLVLTTLNHIQGLAIAGLGFLAVLVWYGIKYHPKPMVGIFAIFIAANVALVFALPRHPLVDTLFRSGTWLNAWFGLDVFSPTSSAGRRVITILGAVGLVNVGAGIILACRNHIVGWLTITPLLALEFPIISLPFANYLAGISPGAIIAFHRVVFCIPPGLALVTLSVRLSKHAAVSGYILRLKARRESIQGPVIRKSRACWPIGTMMVGCLMLVCVPPNYPYCNRAWNALAVTPDDLKMKSLLADFYQSPKHQVSSSDRAIFLVASAGVSGALQSYLPIQSLFTSQERLLHGPPPRSPASDFERIEKSLDGPVPHNQLVYYWPKPTALFTPQSYAGFLSQHWNPAEVALAYTAK